MGMEASVVRYEHQITELETRDDELTHTLFLNNN
jgi:hypothetical protein